MDPVVITVAIVVALTLIGVLFAWERQRAERLHSQYGLEYQRAVDELGRLRAERELANRERRVKQLHLRSLTREQRDRFAESWRTIQAQFVDDPEGAVAQGDKLVEDVMDARGYPISDFDQRLADLSVHHAGVVEDYRDLRRIAEAHRVGEASTEDLRRAMVHLRAVFEDMLEDRERVSEREVERTIEREDATPVRRARPRPDRELPA
jgi:hypothetical protein